MTNARLAIALAASYALLAPGLSKAADAWTQIKNAVVCTECAPPYNLLSVTNTPSTKNNVVEDNIDVYAQWDPGSSVRVASCGPVVTTSTCPTFSTGWVPIPGTTGPGNVPSAVGWGTHRQVFIVDDTQGLSYATRDGGNANAWVGPFSLGSPPRVAGGICSSAQAISQAPGMIAVFVIGCDDNLWHISFQNGQWSQWINVTDLTELGVNVLDNGNNSDFALSVVYDNFSTSGHSAYNQIHVIVSDLFNEIWDINYVFDAAHNYNPTDPASWEEDLTPLTSGGETTAAVSAPRNIGIFGNGSNGNTSPPQPLDGVSAIEQSDSFPAIPSNFTAETVKGGLFEPINGIFVTPAAVTFGKPGGNCNTFPSCRNGVFFLNGAQNIQYSVWNVGGPWDTSFGIKTIGASGDKFTANPVAVVSMQGTDAGKRAYVFAVRGIETTDTGEVYYASVVP